MCNLLFLGWSKHILITLEMLTNKKVRLRITQLPIPKTKGITLYCNANTTEGRYTAPERMIVIVPVFSKDNELTVSHPVFIETVYKAAQEFFRNEQIDTPEKS